MRALYAQYRLAWQPMAVLTLLPLFWAVTWPILIVTGMDPTVTGTVLEALWLAAIAVPPSIGMTLAFTRVDAQRSLTFTHLPGWREDLLTANLVTAFGLGTILGALAAASAGVGAGILTLSLAVASYTGGTLLFDPVLPRSVRIALVSLLAAAIWFFKAVGALLLSGWMVAAPLLVASAALLPWAFSQARARHWPFATWGVDVDARIERSYWSRQRAAAGEWGTPVIGTTWSVRASLHAASRGRGLLYNGLLQAAYGVAAYRLLEQHYFLLLAAGFYWATASVVVPTSPFLPVERAMRARVAWLGALLITALYLGLIVALLPLGRFIPLGLWNEGPLPGNAWVALALAVALSPIVHWNVIRWGAMGPATRRGISLPRVFGGIMVYMLAGVVLLAPLAKSSLSTEVVLSALGAGSVASFGLLWAALHRRFTRGDLARQ